MPTQTSQLLTAEGRYNGVRITGRKGFDLLGPAITGMSFNLSIDAMAGMKLTFLDNHRMDVYASAVVNTGQIITYGDYSFRVKTLSLGGSEAGPTVTLNCVSNRASGLDANVGEKAWDETNGSIWIKSIARAGNYKQVLVQSNLGEVSMKREAPKPGQSKQSDWTLLAGLRRELGAWMFEYGDTFVFGKPTWIAKQGTRRWTFEWNSHTDHTPGMASTPNFSRDPKADEDQREKLELEMIGAVYSRFRPGDVINLRSNRSVGFRGYWMVTEVDVPAGLFDPVSIQALRIIDPIPVPKETGENATSASGEATGRMATTPAGSVAGYSGKQLDNARHIINAGIALGINRHGQTIGVMTAMGESSLINVDRGDAVGPDSRGLFQQRDNGAWGSYSDRMNPTIAATNFFKALMAVSGWQTMPPTAAAHQTQRNADPNHYAKYWPGAQQIVAAIYAANPAGATGGSGSVSSSFAAFMKRYEGVSLDHDGAFGAQCVDLALRYVKDVYGMGTIIGNGTDWWKHPGLAGKFVAVSAGSKGLPGDIISWRPFAFGSVYGHVAILIEDRGGMLYCLTQNPGPVQKALLKRDGIWGFMRPRSTSSSNGPMRVT